MLKRITCIALVIVLMLSLAACGFSAQSDGAADPAQNSSPAAAQDAASGDVTSNSGKIGIDTPITCGITVKMNLEFFKTITDRIESDLKELNPDNRLVVYVSDQDVNKELSNVEDMIIQDMDVIFVTCMDVDGSQVALKKIKDAGKVGIVIDSGCNGMEEYTYGCIQSDNVQAGELAMEALAQAIGGKGEIGVIENTLQGTDNDRGIGRDNVLDKYPDIKIVCRTNTVGLQENAMNAVNDFMQSNPEIVGIWCLGDYAAAGAIAALQQVGREGEVFVVGIDAADVGLDNIRAGYQLGTAAQFPDRLGAAGVERAIEVLNGGDQSFKSILVPTEWVDSGNIDSYK